MLVKDEGKDSNAGGKQRFINNSNINKTNKNDHVGEKQTGKAHTTSNIWQRTHTELQTQGDYKGSKQVG